MSASALSSSEVEAKACTTASAVMVDEVGRTEVGAWEEQC